MLPSMGLQIKNSSVEQCNFRQVSTCNIYIYNLIWYINQVRTHGLIAYLHSGF